MTAFLFRKYFALTVLPVAVILRMICFILKTVFYYSYKAFDSIYDQTEGASEHMFKLLFEGFKKETKEA